MKMAKASDADLSMAMDLSSAFEALTQRFYPTMPQAVAKVVDEDDSEHFNRDDQEQCTRALGHLLELAESASLMRVVYGCAVMLDPRNRCVDPDADTIEHHPDAKAGLQARVAQALDDWHEGIGCVLWWRFPIDEPPYVGSPICDDWPGYHTHWTPIICPDAPAAQEAAQAKEPSND